MESKSLDFRPPKTMEPTLAVKSFVRYVVWCDVLGALPFLWSKGLKVNRGKAAIVKWWTFILYTHFQLLFVVVRSIHIYYHTNSIAAVKIFMWSGPPCLLCLFILTVLIKC